MKQLTLLSLFLTISIISLLSCKTEEKKKVISQISLERWAVSGSMEEYTKDSILYLEIQKFNKNGILESTIYYSPDKTLKAKELRIFKDGKGPIGSQYKDHLDTLLSYYTFTTNEDGLVTKSKAFNAFNNELLRVEELEYSDEGKLLQKTIKNSLEETVRIDKFTLDKNGNEQQVQVLQPSGKEILTEIFNITKYDSEKNWIEKWGFVEDKPFSYLARTISYY